MILLKDKVVLVTGASRGIGKAIATVFAAEGARVICTARSIELLDDTVEEIKRLGGEALAVKADVTVESDVRELVAKGVAKYGKLNALVNNAGGRHDETPIEDYPLELWKSLIESCLTSSFLCTKHVVPHLTKAGSGAIVSISGGAGFRGKPNAVGYCAAKAGQMGIARGMNMELAHLNITSNVIAAGPTEGDRRQVVVKHRANVNNISVEEQLATEPEGSFSTLTREMSRHKGRLNRPEEIAYLAAFLCSDMARNISGQCIALDGGRI